MSPTIATLVRLILGISTSQIEIEKVFFIVEMFITIRRCWLQTKNLDNLICVNKNWPHDPYVRCPKVFDFTFACEAELDLIEELDVEFTNEVQCEEFSKA